MRPEEQRSAELQRLLSWRRLALWLAAAGSAGGAAGAYPAWVADGADGLACGGAALATNALVFLAAGGAVRRVALRHGALAGARLLAWAGLVRIVLMAVLTVAAGAVLGLPRLIFYVWTRGLYIFMALAVALWAGLALRRAGLAPAQRS